MNSDKVRILTAVPGKKGVYLRNVYDPETGKFLIPQFPDVQTAQAFKSFQEMINSESISEIPELKVAILDSGMLQNHPWIKPRLVESIDFTGEGPEDLNGHGTAVTLTSILYDPFSRILNVKVVDAEGYGSPENLVRGIEWSVKAGAIGINLSVGIFNKKWGLWDCRGNCAVCNAAKAASDAGVYVHAAAGNEPGKICCPAKVGVINKNSRVICGTKPATVVFLPM